MSQAKVILKELETLGSESTKRVLMRHGAREPFFGVKVEHLKKIQKRVKYDYQLSLDLYATGNSDAMYLAGLVADPAKMTKRDLQSWADGAYWYMLSQFTVAWVASESRFGRELALKWIASKKEMIASAGWATYSSLVGIKPDDELDLEEIRSLLDRVTDTIHEQKNLVKAAMNLFVIAVGSYVKPLLDKAKDSARRIGKVEVDRGETDCKTPLATEYLLKVEKMGRIGRKRKSARC